MACGVLIKMFIKEQSENQANQVKWMTPGTQGRNGLSKVEWSTISNEMRSLALSSRKSLTVSIIRFMREHRTDGHR